MVNKSVSSLEDLSNITDVQLQKRLKEFNFNCGPITDTTRNLYIKKLKDFLDKDETSINQSTVKQSSSRSNSPNRSNSPVKNVTKTTAKQSPSRSNSPVRSATPKTRRKTIASPILIQDSPKPTRRSSIGRSPSRKTKQTEEIKSSIAFSDSETEDNLANDKTSTSINAALEYSRGNRLLKRTFNNRNSTINKSITKDISPKKTTNTITSTLTRNDSFSSDDSAKKLGGFGYSIKPTAVKSNTPLSTRSTRSFNRINSLSNFSDSENENEEKNNLISSPLSLKNREESSSLTEQITKRLLRHRPTLINTKLNNKKDNSTKYSNNQSSIVSQITSNQTQLTDSSVTSNWISYGILIAGAIFFISIFSFYFYTRYFSISSTEISELSALEKEFDLNIQELIIPSDCSKKNTSYESICPTNKTLRPTLLIIKEMKKIIDNRISNHYCSNMKDDNPFEYKIDQLRNQIEQSIGTEVVKMELQARTNKVKPVQPSDVFLSLFANALDLLKANYSKWFISLVGENDEYEKIVIDQNYPKILHPTCHLKLFMIKTFWYFVTSLIFAVVLTLIYFYVNYTKNQKKKEKELLFELVEKSTELLQSPDEPQSLPILHIRDSILDITQRESPYYQKIWNQAVQFIETSESRIKTSIENIDGEDYKTWKWIGTNQPELNLTTKQQQIKQNQQRLQNNDIQNMAFSEDEITLNRTLLLESQEPEDTTAVTSTPIKGKLFEAKSKTIEVKKQTPVRNNQINSMNGREFVALTCFLKVRNLVDPEIKRSNDNWQKTIHNLIIEKCCQQSEDGKSHGLQHIFVNEGLVYIKCDSIESATNAFEALHNWKYDNKIVQVKFLKEERYYFRFPDAVNLTKILKLKN